MYFLSEGKTFGLARGHRANPYASLRVETVFGMSVLLSGLPSLVLTAKEETLLDQHHKVHIQRLLLLVALRAQPTSSL